MKRLTTLAVLVLFAAAGSAAFGQNLGWPRTIQQPSGTLVLFQPHVDSWDSELVWRQAFQLTPAGGAMRVGAASFEGSSTTNTATKIITISSPELTAAYFPGPDGPAPPALVALLQSLLPPTLDISLEQIGRAFV